MPGDPAVRIEFPLRNSEAAEMAFRQAPEQLRAEILQGAVCMAPAPVPLHQLHIAQLLRSLAKFDRRGRRPSDPGGWLFVPDPEVDLGERPDRFRPDLAAWREHRASFSLRDPAIKIAPDWVCEVLSPSTETIDRAVKAPLYATYGVEWLWFIDPDTKCIEVFHNEYGTFRPMQTFREHDTGGLQPFESVSLEGFFVE